MQLSYTGRKQEGRETLEEVGEEVDNNMTNNMTNMTNNRQISETVCQELLNKTCPIMDRFEAWTTPANGHFVQDPPIGQENDVRITTEWGEQFALIASKKGWKLLGRALCRSGCSAYGEWYQKLPTCQKSVVFPSILCCQNMQGKP